MQLRLHTQICLRTNKSKKPSAWQRKSSPKMSLTDQQLQKVLQNPNFTDKQLLEEIVGLLQDRPEACEYLYLYGELCETIDDLVDEPKSIMLVEKAALLRMQLSRCAFWLKYCHSLWLVERLIDRQYWDMVEWEHSPDEWKRRDARALNHCAYNMFFSVLLLLHGDEALKKISLRFREHAHLRHLNDKI